MYDIEYYIKRIFFTILLWVWNDIIEIFFLKINAANSVYKNIRFFRKFFFGYFLHPPPYRTCHIAFPQNFFKVKFYCVFSVGKYKCHDVNIFRVRGYIIANACCITTIKRSEKQSSEIGKVVRNGDSFVSDLIYQDVSQRTELCSIYEANTNDLPSSNYSKVCGRIDCYIRIDQYIRLFISHVTVVSVGKLIS